MSLFKLRLFLSFFLLKPLPVSFWECKGMCPDFKMQVGVKNIFLKFLDPTREIRLLRRRKKTNRYNRAKVLFKKKILQCIELQHLKVTDLKMPARWLDASQPNGL